MKMLALLLVSLLVIRTERENELVKANCILPSVDVFLSSGACIFPGETTQICATWSGNMNAAEISNMVGFTVISKNPKDVGQPGACFNIKVHDNYQGVIYFTFRGYNTDCGWFDVDYYCFSNCQSGYSCF